MTISVAIKLNGGAAGAPLAIAAGGAITATLDSIAGVNSVTWTIASADDLSVPGDYTLVQSGIVGQTCAFNALATLGTAALLKAVVNGDPTLYALAKFYVLSANGLETGADNEQYEGDATHGTARLMNEAIRAAGTTAGVTATAPLASSGGLTPDISITLGSAGQIIVMNAGATAWARVSVSGDATLTGAGALTVAKVNGTSVNAGGALAVGQVLRATGVAAAEWGAVNLADTDAVTGLLPLANITPGTNAQAFITNAGGTAGAWVTVSGDASVTAAGAVTVAKVNGTSVNAGGALAVGQVLRATGVAAAEWGAVNLADTDAVTGVLPIANVDATATPTASKIPLWDASKYLAAAKFNGEGTTSTAGVFNTVKNVTQLAARNNAGTQDLSLVTTNSSDKTTFGDATNADSADVVASDFVRVLIGALVAVYANDKGVGFGGTPDFGSGAGVQFWTNSTTPPSVAPAGGVVVSSDSAATKVYTPNGLRYTVSPECNDTATQNDLARVHQLATTTNATPTTAYTSPDFPTASQGLVEFFIGGISSGTDLRCAYKVLASVGRAGGALSVDAADVQTIVDNIGVAGVPSVVASTNAFAVQVTGKAATTIFWHVKGPFTVYAP